VAIIARPGSRRKTTKRPKRERLLHVERREGIGTPNRGDRIGKRSERAESQPGMWVRIRGMLHKKPLLEKRGTTKN